MSQLIKNVCGNVEKVMRNVHKIQPSELTEHEVEYETINGIKEGRPNVVFEGIYRIGYPVEMSKCC